jgi:hypothetical protein
MGIVDGLLGIAKMAVDYKTQQDEQRALESLNSPEAEKRLNKVLKFLGEMQWLGPNNRVETFKPEFDEFIKQNIMLYMCNKISFDKFCSNLKNENRIKGYRLAPGEDVVLVVEDEEEKARKKAEDIDYYLTEAFKLIDRLGWLKSKGEVNTGIPEYDAFINELLVLIARGELELGGFLNKVTDEKREKGYNVKDPNYGMRTRAEDDEYNRRCN